MNYYYDLPIEIQENIESNLTYRVGSKIITVKPDEIVNFINNPPTIIQKMLYPKWQPRWGFARGFSEKEIDYHNNEIDKVNKNLIKFFLEFGIKSKKALGYRKALKNGLTMRNSYGEGYINWKGIINSSDHIREYITYDNKNVIISSPYSFGVNSTDEEHFKYKFIKYPNNLYKNCGTYVLVLE